VFFRILYALLLLNVATSWGQSSITIKRATAPILLDAVIDEPDWMLADVASNFKQFFPYDSSFANAQTEIRLTYNDQFIYIAAKMYNTAGHRSFVTPSLRRDFRGEANDGISVVLDTFKDRTNAFIFGVNPFGVQREGQ